MTRKRYALEEVFNEARYPTLTFVQPRDYKYIQSAVRAEGKHITIIGPSGSGKTTLIQKVLSDAKVNNSELVALNGRSYPYAGSALEVLASELECAAEFEEITSYLKLVKFTIIDDFHHLSEDARKEFASTLKLWHERGVRFILIGIASSGIELLGTDGELGIRNDPFELKTQDAVFVREVIRLGSEALNIEFAPQFLEEIVAASNGVPSVVQAICRTACIALDVVETQIDHSKRLDHKLKDLREPILRVFHGKYFDKVMGLAQGKRQARSVHNTYFDIIATIASDGRSEFPIPYLREKVLANVEDPKERNKKSTSFYNCLNNLDDVFRDQGLSDAVVYSRSGKYISIEDPSLRFYLNLIDMDDVKQRIHVRDGGYPWDVAISFAGEDRSYASELNDALKERGIITFYDFDNQDQLWGKDLTQTLSEVYANSAMYMLVVVSKNYPLKDWTNFEFENGKSGAKKRGTEYLLPVRLDDTPLVGLPTKIGHLDLRQMTSAQVADLLAEKIAAYDPAGDS